MSGLGTWVTLRRMLMELSVIEQRSEKSARHEKSPHRVYFGWYFKGDLQHLFSS